MSESSVTDAASLSTGSPFASQAGGYDLHSDLARLCLPSEFRDRTRKLAWVNSICFLFLIIGLVGLRAPKVIVKPLSKPQENIPVVFTPPDEQKVEPEVKQEEPEPQETPLETPQVAPVVAAADSSSVAFAVPTPGAISVADARYATPPPSVAAPPTPRTFIPGQGEGNFPWPHVYPREARAERMSGTVMLSVIVDPSGVPVKVEIKDSSGHAVLDRFAEQWVKDKWRWLPGETRYYYVPFQFKLQ